MVPQPRRTGVVRCLLREVRVRGCVADRTTRKFWDFEMDVVLKSQFRSISPGPRGPLAVEATPELASRWAQSLRTIFHRGPLYRPAQNGTEAPASKQHACASSTASTSHPQQQGCFVLRETNHESAMIHGL